MWLYRYSLSVASKVIHLVLGVLWGILYIHVVYKKIAPAKGKALFGKAFTLEGRNLS